MGGGMKTVPPSLVVSPCAFPRPRLKLLLYVAPWLLPYQCPHPVHLPCCHPRCYQLLVLLSERPSSSGISSSMKQVGNSSFSCSHWPCCFAVAGMEASSRKSLGGFQLSGTVKRKCSGGNLKWLLQDNFFNIWPLAPPG
jgi:hypothetical protein